MKNLLFSAILFTFTTGVFAQGQTPVKFNVDYSTMNSGTQGAGDKNEFDEEPNLKFELIFSNVNAAAKAVLDASKIKLEGEPNPTQISTMVSGVVGYYNSDNQTYKIDLSGELDPASFDWESQGYKTSIEIQKSDNTVLHSFAVELKPKNVEPVSLSKTETQIAIQRYFETQIYGPNSKNKYNLTSVRNALVDDNDVIHLFLDAYGKFYGAGIPTAATQDNWYQFHILIVGDQAKEYSFSVLYTGEYQPELLSILNTAGNPASATSGKKVNDEISITMWDGAIKGPYTVSFSAEITRKKGSDSKKIVDATIKIAKLYNVSISTGLLWTNLENPQNIETATKADGTTTLIADDPRDRGVLTIMATYYPMGRSFLFPPSGGVFDRSRFGVQVGTKLGDDLAENFFLGLSHDFARGGAFSYGAHYGRRNYIAGAPNFKFGEDVFNLPDLNVKKEWGLAIYVGVVIDTRVAVELIKSLAGNN